VLLRSYLPNFMLLTPSVVYLHKPERVPKIAKIDLFFSFLIAERRPALIRHFDLFLIVVNTRNANSSLSSLPLLLVKK